MSKHRVGSVDISKVVDFEQSPWRAEDLFPDVTPAMLAEGRATLPPGFIHPREDLVYLSFHSYVLRSGGRTILVDTCVGNCKERRSLPSWNMLRTPFLENLAAVGVRPEDVDIVLSTHLHADHVGWNTRLLDGRWVPTFPNARYLMERTEFEHFRDLHATHPAVPVTRGAFADSVLPVVDSGQAMLVEMDHVLEGIRGDGIWLEPSVGHSPGHVCVHVGKGRDQAILSGDVIHSPIQFTHPDLCSAADFDRDGSRRSRRALMERLAETGALLLTSHFPNPTAGRLSRQGDGYAFRFSD
ncbi:MAG: MBL fold metallo-hydrolase [Janthinobacterium lividum]